MRWLFVYNTLRLGGIETLIVRLANFLASQGDEVAILTQGGELLPHLGAPIDTLIFKDRKHAVDLAQRWLAASPSEGTLVSFDPISAAIAPSIECRAGPAVGHISGIYHPRAYFMDSERADRRLLNRLVARAIGIERLYFINDECRAEKQDRWGVALDASPIIPVPLTERARRWDRSDCAGTLRIVSVGRLTDFKQYNLGAPGLVRELLDEGVDVAWDIYGSGELRRELEEQIALQKVAGKLNLCGDLPYEQLEEKLLQYDIFIGLGTAAAEAAMLGVPTIAATDGSRTESFGWFNELPFGNFGERQVSRRPRPISEFVRHYLVQSAATRRALSDAHHVAAKRYSLHEVARLLTDFTVAEAAVPSPSLKCGVATLYALLTDSSPIRLTRRARSIVRRKS